MKNEIPVKYNDRYYHIRIKLHQYKYIQSLTKYTIQHNIRQYTTISITIITIESITDYAYPQRLLTVHYYSQLSSAWSLTMSCHTTDIHLSSSSSSPIMINVMILIIIVIIDILIVSDHIFSSSHLAPYHTIDAISYHSWCNTDAMSITTQYHM